MPSSFHQPSKTFTVDAVNKLLPQVTDLIRHLQSLQEALDRSAGQSGQVQQKLSMGNGHPIEEPRGATKGLTMPQVQLVEAMQSGLRQLEALGAELKDLGIGLVDWPSLLDGQLVSLCWKLGEPQVRFWHSLEEGFSGRQPIEGHP